MGRKNKILLFIFIAIIALIPCTSSAYPFLTKSKILKELGVQILVGENQADAIVFDKDVLKEYDVPIDGSGSFIITANGIVPLKGKTSKKNLFNMCADPYPGIGFNKVNGKGIFIANGTNLKGVIHWYPAEFAKIEQSKCFNNLTAGKVKFSSYQSTVLKAIIHQARWSRKLTKNEIMENCKSFADLNAKRNQQTPVEDLYEECLSSSWPCRDEERLIITFENNNGDCKEVTNSRIDCDGRAGIGEGLREFLGTMIIKKDKAQEIWLIWNAPGYEGDGIYAIEIKDLEKKERPSEEWLVYNGC